MSNPIPAAQKVRFSVAMTTEKYQSLVHNTLRDPARANRFISAITSAVAVNPELQDCDAGTILACGLLGESLGLNPSPQLGDYYLVPFENKLKGPDGKPIYLFDKDGKHLKDKKGRWAVATEKKAQFILGYKGYTRMAVRSKQYRLLNVIEIKENELRHWDPLNEEIECILIEDFDAREAAPTVGYYAMFETLDGFRKAIYWSRAKVEAHADRYSPAFSSEAYHRLQRGEIPEDELWKYSSFWYKDFDVMARKTMLRQLISKWGVMSSELITAMDKDNQIITMSSPGVFSGEVPEPLLSSPEDGPPEPIAEAAPPADAETVDIHAL